MKTSIDQIRDLLDQTDWQDGVLQELELEDSDYEDYDDDDYEELYFGEE